MNCLLHRPRGTTLLEMIIYISIFAFVGVMTMNILGQSRVIRGNARDRTRMILIAQQEIDLLSANQEEPQSEGIEVLHREDIPAEFLATREYANFDDRHWQVTIHVSKPSAKAKPEVELVTLLRKAEP